MKHLSYSFIAIAVLLMSVSCTNEKQIIEIAEKYVSEKICPLLPDASVSEHAPAKSVNPVYRIKGAVKKLGFVNNAEEFLLNFKALQVRFGSDSKGQFKNSIILCRLYQSCIDALEKADSEQGFYVVGVSVKYDNNQHARFDIVLSKQLDVLNLPIDMEEVNNSVKRVYAD